MARAKGKRLVVGHAAGPKQGDAEPPRVRSARYPGVGLEQCVTLCRSMAKARVDGLPAASIAKALGYRNVRTNSFSAALSASRQFGVLALHDGGYGLTALGRALLAQAPEESARARHQEAFRQPPLYAALIERLADKPVPEASVLAGLVERAYPVSPGASGVAAEMFLASARFAGALGPDNVLRLGTNSHTPEPAAQPAIALELPLWGADQGKVILLRAPAAITPESFERFVQAVRLHVRVEEPAGTRPAKG